MFGQSKEFTSVMKNTIFYSKSKKDENSPRFLKIMEKMPFAGDFIYYCVDPDPVTKKRNDDLLTVLGITDVPTMYYDSQKFVGKDAFDFLRVLVHQMQQDGYESPPYPPHQQQPMFENPQQQPMMPPQMQGPPMMPGMGQMPQIGGFSGMGMGGGGRMPPGAGSVVPPGPQLEGNGSAGSGVSGGLQGGTGNGDLSFADPFAVTDITGINSMGNFSPEQLLTPVQTKNQDGSSRMDDMLKEYSNQRDSMIPSQATGNMPGMNVSMQQMQMPQMRR